ELDPTLPANRALGNAALAVDASSNLYLLLNSVTSAGSAAEVAVSKDGGQTWSPPIDVGAPFGIQNVEFPMAVAGNDGSAAVAFYGTQTGGNDQVASFPGSWEVYEAVTTDGGASWQTSDVTGESPVQVGQICLTGQTCTGSTRNLLDFQEMTADQNGRILIGYADGCPATGTCTQQNSTLSSGWIAREMSGPTLGGGTLTGPGGQVVPASTAAGFTATESYVAVGGDATVVCPHAISGLPSAVPDIGGGCYIGLPPGLTTLDVTFADQVSAKVQGTATFKDSAGNAIGSAEPVCGSGPIGIPSGAADIYINIAQEGAVTGTSCPGAGPGTTGTVILAAPGA
ncbi:MAG: sialidase family protein, partial [Mycobacteriales bacterium]